MKRPRLFSTALCLLIGLFGITAQADMTLDEVTARLKPMAELPILTGAYGVRHENEGQLEHGPFMAEWVRVTGTYGLKHNAPASYWAAVRAANPRAYTVNISPFGKGNGSYEYKGRLLHLERGQDPTKWPDYWRWLSQYRRNCLCIGAEAGGTPVYLLLDYEHGAHWPNQYELLRRLNYLVTIARRCIPRVTVIWYQLGNAHFRDSPHPQWVTAHVVPEGVLNDKLWNVQLYDFNDRLLTCMRVQRAVSQHLHWRGSAWISIGTKRTMGHPDRLREFAEQIYSTKPEPWGFHKIDIALLWPDPGEWLDEESGEKRGMDWDTLLTFFEAAGE